MEFQVSIVLAVMITSLSLGEALRLTINSGVLSSATIQCTEEQKDQSVMGPIRALSVQVLTVIRTTEGGQATRTYVMRPVVELSAGGTRTWGPGFDYRSRSYLTGLVRTGMSSLNLEISQTDCRDALNFLCVATGSSGTVDSNQGSIRTPSILQETPVIKGGRRCPSHNMNSDDRCDIYAAVGETVDLSCKVKTALPLEWNIVTWYLNDINNIQKGGNVKNAIDDSSPVSCKANMTSTLRYRHVPWGSDDVMVFCRVQFVQGNSSVVVTKSTRITACTEGSDSKSFSLNEAEIAGVFMAGVAAMVVLVVVIVMCVACCGRSIKVHQKNKLAVTRM